MNMKKKIWVKLEFLRKLVLDKHKRDSKFDFFGKKKRTGLFEEINSYNFMRIKI